MADEEIPAAESSTARPKPLRALFEAVFGPLRYHPTAIRALEEAQARGTIVHVARSSAALRLLNMGDTLRALGLGSFTLSLGFLDGIRHLFRRLPRRVSTSWLRLYKNESPNRREVALATTVLEGTPSLLFVAPPAFRRLSQGYLQALLRAQRVSDTPIMLAVQAVLDPLEASTPERTEEDLQAGKTGRAHPLRHFISHGRHNMQVYCAGVINLLDFINEQEEAHEVDREDGALADALFEKVERALERQERTIASPAPTPLATIRNRILNDDLVQDTMQALVEDGEDPAVLRTKARYYVGEIAARYSSRVVRRFANSLTFVFNRIYDGLVVDEEGLQTIQEHGKRGPIVYCPSHRSHIDYLVLPYVMLQRGMAPPHVAAGANLSFFPLGTLFRRGGAFFLRRSFRGNLLYRKVFEAYVRYLVRGGTSIEFFVEGTRSRTGKLLMPRFGLLGMIVDAWREGDQEDLSFVPISIDYERIIESGSYERELAGGAKKAENISGLLKSTRVLRSRYGRVHLQFGEAISIRGLAESAGLPQTPARHCSPETNAAWKAEVERLAYRVMDRVARVSSVTPIAIVATTLLAHAGRGLAHSRLLEHAKIALRYLSGLDARMAQVLRPSDEEWDQALEEALKVLCEQGMVITERAGITDAEDIHRVPDEHRVELDYYKNGLINYFAPSAIAARCILLQRQAADPNAETICFSDVEADTQFLSYLFKREFYYPVDSAFESHLRDTLEILQSQGLIELKRGVEGIEVKLGDEGTAERLRFLSGVLDAYTEAYWVFARTLQDLRRFPMGDKELIQRSLDRARRAFLEGEISRPEAANKTVMMSALDFMLKAGVIETSTQDRKSALRLSDSHSGEGLESFVDAIGRFVAKP